MTTQEILNFCLKKGLLVDGEILNLFSEARDIESVKLIIEKIKEHTNQRIITRQVIDNNKEQVCEFLSNLPKQSQESLEKFKIKLGLSLEILRHTQNQTFDIETSESILGISGVKILSEIKPFVKKPEVGDFVKYFRNRFSELRNILQGNPRLENLVSIDKLANSKQNISIIGMVKDKRITKNKNMLVDVEDLTGGTRILINQNREELFEEAQDIALDCVVGVRGTGNREIVFANDVVFPDAMLATRKSSPADEYALFIGDLHLGSRLFLKDSFLKFIDYLNRETAETRKIKYLFILGDVVSGIGNYPSQEKDLEILDLEEQYSLLAEYLKKIRKDINIIISPGNHDGVRLMEPQPLFDEKYAWQLYNLPNVTLTENPAHVNIGARGNFPGFDVLMYHGFSYTYYADNIQRLMLNKAMHSPDLIMKYLLKVRHLAPTHSSAQYFPLESDPLVIKNIPDIFVSGHTHKSAVSYYNNILVISTSSWESITPYEEKMGAKPDFCKVPMINLKTREIKILDFEDAN